MINSTLMNNSIPTNIIVSAALKIKYLELVFISQIIPTEEFDLSALQNCLQLTKIFLRFDQCKELNGLIKSLISGVSKINNLEALVLALRYCQVVENNLLSFTEFLQYMSHVNSITFFLQENVIIDSDYEHFVKGFSSAVDLKKFTMMIKNESSLGLLTYLPSMTTFWNKLEELSINLQFEYAETNGVTVKFPIKHLTTLKKLHLKLVLKPLEDFLRGLFIELQSLNQLSSLILDVHQIFELKDILEMIKNIKELKVLEYCCLVTFSGYQINNDSEVQKEEIRNKIQTVLKTHSTMKKFEFGSNPFYQMVEVKK